jgi:hypothetical protein
MPNQRISWWLADPASAAGGGAGGESGFGAEAGHDRGDVAADGGDADSGAAGDRGVGQAFGHELEYALLGWRQAVGARAKGMSAVRVSRVIQSWRAVLRRDADRSLIWAGSVMAATRWSGKLAVMGVG